ncbi:ParB/RepB/Spo0J family partition protein [Dactylosporangium darangshiense]|uniref:ParB-like N-terminal domain-containing protein n=1 Tax=Dactylosporangium darangshiense TaxID=579108 RepID=A0ABP8DNB6_9ACTN
MSTAVLPLAPGNEETTEIEDPGAAPRTDDAVERFGEVVDGVVVDDSETEPNDSTRRVALPPLVAKNLDPRDLIDNPNNLRKDVGDLNDLKASMARIGILCPLVVIPTWVDGGGEAYMIVIGHRRKYAAIALRWTEVPCIIAADDGEALQIIAQLAENGHRVGLTASEEAEAYYQLTLLDWTPEAIAKVRAIPLPAVQQSLRLRQLPAAAAAAVDNGTMTLTESAALDQLADDLKALDRVLAAGSGYKHVLASELAKRKAAKAVAVAKAELVLAGVPITSKPKGFGSTSTEVAARLLVDADGNRLEPATVRTMPGFAAFVEKGPFGGAETVVYCKDPEAWGYRRYTPSFGPTLSAQELARRAERERRRAEHLAALQVAAGVRRDFVREHYGSAKAAKVLFPDALRQVLTGTHDLEFEDVDGLYTTLGGAGDDVLRTAGIDRLSRALVARWICAHERNLGFAASDYPAEADAQAVAFWYERLNADGYTLADAEAVLLESLTNPDRTHDDEDDDGPDEDAEDAEHDANAEGRDEDGDENRQEQDGEVNATTGGRSDAAPADEDGASGDDGPPVETEATDEDLIGVG